MITNTDEDAWTKLIESMRRARAHPEFDELERDYKLEAADAIRKALQEATPERGDWIDKLRRALGGRNNLTDYRDNGELIRVLNTEEGRPLRELLSSFQEEPDPESRFEAFAQAARGTGVARGILALGAILNFALDHKELPPIRSDLFQKVERLVGAVPAGDASPEDRYAHHLEFARECRRRLEEAGVPIRDMVDVQSLIYWIARGRALEPEEGEGTVHLVGAAKADATELADEYAELLARFSKAAVWWSFPLNQEMEAALRDHPFLYLYTGQPHQHHTHRCHVVEWQTKSGSSGLETPWPEMTPEEWRGKRRLGPAKTEVFKTWFLVDQMEELDPPIAISELERLDGKPPFPSALQGGFQLWRLRPEQPSAPEIDDLASATFLTRAEIEEIEQLLLKKRQIILEGPPGSGKTYVADRFARYFTGNPLSGAVDERFVTVQFHQLYGYEDFVQGIRPSTDPETGQLRYDVRDGVFKALSLPRFPGVVVCRAHHAASVVGSVLLS